MAGYFSNNNGPSQLMNSPDQWFSAWSTALPWWILSQTCGYKAFYPMDMHHLNHTIHPTTLLIKSKGVWCLNGGKFHLPDSFSTLSEENLRTMEPWSNPVELWWNPYLNSASTELKLKKQSLYYSKWRVHLFSKCSKIS